jgi:hypothetical protein
MARGKGAASTNSEAGTETSRATRAAPTVTTAPTTRAAKRPGWQNPGVNRLGQAETAEETLEGQIYDLSFGVHKSRRYHEKLCAFYSGWRDWVKIVTVVTGSGLFLLLISDWQHVAEFVSAFIALWAMLDYLVAPDKKAERHADLYKRFTALAAKIETMQHTLDSYQQLAAARLSLEENEPPCKRLVDLQARNDECRARGFPPDYLVPLSRWQRYFGYFFTFGMDRLERWNAEHQVRVAASSGVRNASPSA